MTEVSFINLYEGQPSYGEIDLELRGHGFVPHTFAAINRRMLRPLQVPDPHAAMNQVLEADVVYVRDFRRPELMSDGQLKNLALLAHHVWRSYDLTASCMQALLDRKTIPSSSLDRYCGFVAKQLGRR